MSLSTASEGINGHEGLTEGQLQERMVELQERMVELQELMVEVQERKVNAAVDYVNSLYATSGQDAKSTKYEQVLYRQRFIERYGFSHPSGNMLRGLYGAFKHTPILSIGSGCAFFENILQKMDMNVIVTDPGLTHQNPGMRQFCSVENLTANDAITKYSDVNVLMINWPDYDNEWAFLALELFSEKATSESRVVYCGEGDGGCTADQAFHDLLSAKWKEVASWSPPRWGTALSNHDYCGVYRLR